MQTKYLVSIYYHSTPSKVYQVFFRPCNTQSFTGKHGKRYDLDLQLHDISWVKVLQTKTYQKNIKSWLEHRNSYGHVFSLKIEASMNPLLYKLSNFQGLQSETWSGSSKVTFFSGAKKTWPPKWGINPGHFEATGGHCSCDRCFRSKTRFQSDSKLSPSCASTPYLSSWDFLVAGEPPVIDFRFRVLYKWLQL